MENNAKTNDKIEVIAELLKKLGTDIGTFVLEQGEHNKRIDAFIVRMDVFFTKLDKIFDKLSEK